MMGTEDILDIIIRHEGSKFTATHLDKGGPTKYGITLTTLRHWRSNPNLSSSDVEKLTEIDARNIYETDYIITPGFNKIKNGNVRAALVDWGVTSGPRVAIKALQHVLGVDEDGVLGPLTATRANATNARLIFNDLLAARRQFYASIVRQNPSQEKFINGWLNRVNDFSTISWI